MRKLTFLIVLFCTTVWSQDYGFLSKESFKVTSKEFSKIKDTTFIITTYLESGEAFNDNNLENLSKSKDRYQQALFLDTINKKKSIVLRKMTEAEIKSLNKKFSDNIEKDKKNRKELKGKVIENLNLTDLNGNIYTLEDLKGKVIVLNFWFTKCAPCIKEIPDLNKMLQKHGTENVAYFAITFDEKEIVEEFIKKKQIDFTIIPEDTKTIEQFSIGFYPTNIIIDKEGKVKYVNEFFMKDMIEDMNKLIEKLLSKS